MACVIMQKCFFHSRSDVCGYEKCIFTLGVTCVVTKKYFHSRNDMHCYEKRIFTLEVTCFFMKICEHVTPFKLIFEVSVWRTTNKLD